MNASDRAGLLKGKLMSRGVAHTPKSLRLSTDKLLQHLNAMYASNVRAIKDP